MTAELILLIDLGTQSLRATVLNRSGERVFSKSLPVSTRRQGECHEQAPTEWGAGMLELLAAVGAERDLAGSIRAIAACGTLGGMVAVDGRGEPLRPAILYSDQRPAACIGELEATAYFQATCCLRSCGSLARSRMFTAAHSFYWTRPVISTSC